MKGTEATATFAISQRPLFLIGLMSARAAEDPLEQPGRSAPRDCNGCRHAASLELGSPRRWKLFRMEAIPARSQTVSQDCEGDGALRPLHRKDEGLNSGCPFATP